MLSREHRSCKRAGLGTQSAGSIIFASNGDPFNNIWQTDPVRGVEQFQAIFIEISFNASSTFKIIPFYNLTHCKSNSTNTWAHSAT
jgi:hypothetical protein